MLDLAHWLSQSQASPDDSKNLMCMLDRPRLPRIFSKGWASVQPGLGGVPVSRPGGTTVGEARDAEN